MLVFDQDINKAITDQLKETEQKIRIIMYSISPHSGRTHALFNSMWRELIRACSRTKDCKIILSGWPENNPQNIVSARAADVLRKAGAAVTICKPGRIIHPKAWSFDDKTLIIGSHNATQAGFMTTKNISYIGHDLAEMGQFNDYFDKQWQSITQPI